MPRYRLTVEYDGSAFVGWQRQENGHSVQAALEDAAAALANGTAVTAFAAGRTDSGVHALGQVVHIDLPRDYQALVDDAVRQAKASIEGSPIFANLIPPRDVGTAAA